MYTVEREDLRTGEKVVIKGSVHNFNDWESFVVGMRRKYGGEAGLIINDHDSLTLGDKKFTPLF